MADARHENENLREQVKLLKQSMQALFDNQRKAQEEVEYLRKVQSKGTRSLLCDSWSWHVFAMAWHDPCCPAWQHIV